MTTYNPTKTSCRHPLLATTALLLGATALLSATRVYATSPNIAPAPIPLSASLSELQERFKTRYPELQKLKLAGKVGETYKGFIGAVRPEFESDPNVQQILANENADRRELYHQLAQQTGTTPDEVASRNAARNFEKARSGEWLQYANGQWKQKP